jgi:hypothetical protein
LEPDVGTVTLRAVGLTWDAVAAVIAGMRRVDPSVMPVLQPPPPVVRCVDAGTRLAPGLVPPGWKRYVLEAHPTGLDTLRAVAESVRAFDDDEWAELVATVGQDRG